jgi:hypothetical protein
MPELRVRTRAKMTIRSVKESSDVIITWYDDDTIIT